MTIPDGPARHPRSSGPLGPVVHLARRIRQAGEDLLLVATRHSTATSRIVLAVGLIAAVTIAAILCRGYLSALERNRTWADKVEFRAQDGMLRAVFERAVDAGLIRVALDKAGPRIDVASCENTDHRLGPRGIGPLGENARKAKEVLSLLCTTVQGAEIREEIRQWNAGEYRIIVRDDRRKPAATGGTAGFACDPPAADRRGQPPMVSPVAMIPRGCIRNRWRIATRVGGDPGSPAIEIEPLGLEPAPEDYAFIEDGEPLYMSDWAGLVPPPRIGPIQAGTHQLSTVLTLPDKGPVRIDLVGTLRQIQVARIRKDGTEDQGSRVMRKAGELPVADTACRKTGPTDGTPAPDGTQGVGQEVGQGVSQASGQGIGMTVRILCDASSDPRRPFSYRIDVTGPPGQEVSVTMDVEFQRSLPNSLLARLKTASPVSPAPATPATSAAVTVDETAPEAEEEAEETDDEDTTWSVGTRTPNLDVRCPDDLNSGTPDPCTIAWREREEDERETAPSDPVGKSQPSSPQVSSSQPSSSQSSSSKASAQARGLRVQMAGSPTNLVDPETGAFTKESLELGLAPIVGAGRSQWGSLGWVLQNAGVEKRSVTLSINADEQTVVRDVLEERRTKCRDEGRPDCFFARRNAQAVVALLDASEDHEGEVRALVAWPRGRTGVHAWDLAAGGGTGRGRSWRMPATAPVAWSIGADNRSQPGSTFKVVTALAAAQAVLDGRDKTGEIGRMLRGEMTLAEAGKALDLRRRVEVPRARRRSVCEDVKGARIDDANTLFVPTSQSGKFRCVQNFEHNAYKNQFLNLTASRCPPAGSAKEQIGVCEALMKSSNIYFGGLALLLDGKKVMESSEQQEVTGPLDNLGIAAMADRLTPKAEGNHPGLSLFRGSLPREPAWLRLDRRPVLVQASLPTSPTRDRRVDVALSGYGQNVLAAPLTMAGIYLSLRNKQVVIPSLVPLAAIAPEARPGKRTALLEGGSEQQRKQYIDLIHAGLHAVPARGSASGAFKGPERRCLVGTDADPRLYGKTGTATIGRDNTVWFTGWIEGRPDRGIARPLAFVCQVIRQPSDRKPALTGGSVCAPLIRDILQRLDRPVPGKVAAAQTPSCMAQAPAAPSPRRPAAGPRR